MSKLLFTVTTEAANAGVDTTGSGEEDSNIRISTFEIRQTPGLVTALQTSGASFGTTSATIDDNYQNIYGVYVTKGTWIYTGNDDWYGNDSFTMAVTGDWGTFNIPVSVTVNPVDDAIDDTFSIFTDTATDIDVSTNDLWSAAEVRFEIAAGGEPTQGTVTIPDEYSGVLRYTPNLAYTGPDEITYRGVPTGGVGEAATINIYVDYEEDVAGTEAGNTQLVVEQTENLVLEYG